MKRNVEVTMMSAFLIYAILLVAAVFMIEGWVSRKVRSLYSTNPARHAYQVMRVYMTMVGVASFVLLFRLPSTPSFSSFRYPGHLEEVQFQERVLVSLQEHNQVLERTVQTVHWFLFVFVFWFLPSLLQFAKDIAKLNGEPSMSTEAVD